MERFSIYFSPSDYKIYFFLDRLFHAEMLSRIISAIAGGELSPFPVPVYVPQAFPACNSSWNPISHAPQVLLSLLYASLSRTLEYISP